MHILEWQLTPKALGIKNVRDARFGEKNRKRIKNQKEGIKSSKA